MPRPFYRDSRKRLYHGDALDVSRGLGDGLVNCIVTSPPYYALRDYGTNGQYGLEKTPAEYVERLRTLFHELRRVLADDGTLWLNLGDSYSSGNGNKTSSPQQSRNGRNGVCGPRDLHSSAARANLSHQFTAMPPAKNLLGIPWRTAFALQDDGWILRNAIVWNKPNAMPESVTDRLSGKYEHVFLFSKRQRYWFDLDAVREPHADESIARAQSHRADPGQSYREGRGFPVTMNAQTLNATQMVHANGRNPGDVWTITTHPFPAAHFATYPVELAQRCILAGCKPGGTVLDPFAGSCTTGVAARNAKRRFLGIDINANYLRLALTHPHRFGKGTP